MAEPILDIASLDIEARQAFCFEDVDSAADLWGWQRTVNRKAHQLAGEDVWCVPQNVMRMPAFIAICDEIECDAQYFALLRQIWLMSDAPTLAIDLRQDPEALKKIFCPSRDTRYRHCMMTREEQCRLAELPDPVRVFRGTKTYMDDRGWSWTTDQSVAELFATRFNDDGYVLIGTVRRANVIAYLHDRKESEIIADPRAVDVCDFEELTADDTSLATTQRMAA